MMSTARERHVEALRFNMGAACRQHRADTAGEAVTVADYEQNLASMREQQASGIERAAGAVSRWGMAALVVLLIVAGGLGMAGVGRPTADIPVLELKSE